MKQFNAPKESLGDLDADAAATLIAATADIALVLDGEGHIRDLAFNSDELAQEWSDKWQDQPWVETVTVESRPKIEALLRDAVQDGTPRWRQVNHATSAGADVPVLYSAVQVGGADRVVAVGRDLRAISALQQRLVEAQQSMERDYARLRHAETRYRLLFQTSSEAFLIVDAASHKVVEANPAAAQLLGEASSRMVGRVFPQGFDEEGRQAIEIHLAGLRAAGRAEDVRARLQHGMQEFVVSASMFRQEASAFFLVRLVPVDGGGAAPAVPRSKAMLLRLLEGAPDAFVVTGEDGRVLSANSAFLEMVQLATETQAEGESLERWLGRPGVDLNVLIANLRQHGSVKLFATTLRGEYGASTEVEISAVAVPSSEETVLGFAIRDVGRRLAGETRVRRELPRSVEQLTELVGRVPLKEIVRESTDVIERLCIEAALELTHDNRASAAEMLGLSRQSLYVKLRRYGLSDAGSTSDDGA